jgi:VanZ family protein
MNLPSRLPRYLSVAYALLIVYVCLHPFSDWRDGGLSPWAFVIQPWPKYLLWSDVWENIAGYLPLGFVLCASLRGKHRPGTAFLLAICCCAGLSFSVEFIQNYLPSRVASNLDLGTNVFGAILGAAAGLRWGRIFDEYGSVERWRARHILPGHIGELGLILIALWWLSQLEPTTTLFGNGDLRLLFDLPAPMAFSARRYMILESAIVASNTLGLGLLLMRAMREIDARVLGIVLLTGLGLRSLADYVFMIPADPLHWATTGGLRGLAIGITLVFLASRLPRWSQHSLASLTLLCLTALVNMAPDNPYVDASVRTIQEGHFLNFYGLTQLSAALWPFLALTYLSALAGLRRW